jgi:hypothetical protein
MGKTLLSPHVYIQTFLPGCYYKHRNKILSEDLAMAKLG